MYSHRKPKNLYISSFEGIDTSGKTTAFQGCKYKVIHQSFLQQMSKGALIQLCDKYEIPLQTEGFPLFDDYGSFFMMNVNKNTSFLNDELESSKQDFYICRQSDCFVKMFLRLPSKNTPSYEKIKKVLEADGSIPKRQEHRFKTFVINYHESMQPVFTYLKTQLKSKKPAWHILYTDRSWISNFVYNGYTGDIENPNFLLKKVKQAGYHPIDFVTLFIIDKTTLHDRLQERSHLSYYEKYGIDRLLKMQEKYLFLIRQLHKLDYIKEYNVVNKVSMDI